MLKSRQLAIVWRFWWHIT